MKKLLEEMTFKELKAKVWRMVQISDEIKHGEE